MKTVSLAALIAVTLAPAAHAQETATGPSSSQTPYLIPTAPGVKTTSILTVGDSVDGYRLAGLPDGLGAFDNDDGTFTLLVGHEITADRGVVRAHGGKGAFVSKWVIDKHDFRVVSGEDLMQQALTWDFGSGQWTPITGAALNFSRFCSADLPEVSAFFDRRSGRGTRERIFMTGEESGVEGRAVAHVVTGDAAGRSYELPWLGRLSWENAVAKPDTDRRTVVAGLDDGTGGQVYFYVGEKTYSADPIEAAGLRNGVVYGLKLEIGAGRFTEANDSVIADGTRFSLVNLGDISQRTGAQLETLSNSSLVSTLQRPEDGSWDPTNRANFYFQTTASFTGISRLWRLTFDDPQDVTRGGTLRIIVQSPAFDAARANAEQAGPRMLDNLTVDKRGQVISVEDVGNNAYIGGVWQTQPQTRTVRKVAEHDRARFATGAPGFLTADEEASGVIPLKGIRGGGWYLIDSQAHYATDAETVEGGQLLVIHIPGLDDDDDREDDGDRDGK